MTTSAKTHRATDVRVQDGKLTVVLEDGRELSVPLSWFPRLARAGEEELQNWQLIGPGVGVHWPDVDEHVSVESILHPENTIPSREIRRGPDRLPKTRPEGQR